MTEPLSRPLPTSAAASAARPAEDLRGTDPLPYPSATDDPGMLPDHESPPSAPRWVMAFGIIAVVLVLLFVAMHFTGMAPTHGPSGGTEHGMLAP